jgi:hypothetical protein
MGWAQPILARFADTYAEVSSSGSGIKIWCQASLTRGRKIEFFVDGVKCTVEAYSQRRFFTVTGQRWRNSPLDIRPHGPDIEMALEVADKLAKPSPAAAASATTGPISEGRRHDAIKKMGIKLRAAGMDATMIEAALLAFNAQRCSPPKPEAEVREIVRWVTEHHFGDTIDTASLPKLTGLDGETVYNRQVEEVKPIIEGMLYPGCTIFCGPPKSGKSWLMLQAALAVAGETALAGRLHVCHPGKGLYLALEESEARTTRRMRKLTPQSDCLGEITFVYRKDIRAAADGGIYQIEEYLKTHAGVRLVVIDTYLAFQRVERKRTNDLLLADYNSIQPLQEMATKYDVAIVIVDHSRKMGGDPIDVLSGTTGKSAAPDAAITLQRQSDGTSLLNVIPRDAETTVYQMKLFGDGDTDHSFGWCIVNAGEDATTSAEAQQVIDLLRELPLGPKEIARQLGIKEGTIRMRLKRLVERSRVQKDNEGKYHAL